MDRCHRSPAPGRRCASRPLPSGSRFLLSVAVIAALRFLLVLRWSAADAVEIHPDIHACGPMDAPCLVLPSHALGLGNRFRQLASASILALELERTLIVDWRPDPSCNAEIGALFDVHRLPFTLRDSTASTYNPDAIAALIGPLARTESVKRKNYALVDGNEPEKGGSEASTMEMEVLHAPYHYVQSLENFQSEAHVLVLAWSGHIALDHLTCQEQTARKRWFYRRLADAAALPVRAIIQDLDTALFSSSLIVGLHVRSHDDAYDWRVVAPQEGDEALTFDEAAPKEVMLQLAQSIHERLPGSTILVLSNNAELRTWLLQKLPDGAALSPSIALARDTRAGMHAALAEWIILSRCALIIHTSGSSYGTEAVILGRAPSIQVIQGTLLYGPDDSLPFCNDVQRASILASRKSARGSGDSGCAGGASTFADSTEMLCRSTIEVSECSFVQKAWNLSHPVYCLQ